MRGPGHMGNRRVTVLNQEVVKVDPDKNLLAIKGAIPGARNSLVLVRGAAKTRLARRKRPLEE